MLKDRLAVEFNNIRFNLRRVNIKLVRMVFVVSIFLSIPATAYLAQRGFFSETKAGVSATFSFSPTSFLLPGDKSVSLLLNTGTSKVGFAQAEIKFDQSKVKIVSFTPGAKLTRVISLTDVATANQSGVFRSSLGLEPGSYANAPSGTFEVGRFTFSSNTASPNIKSQISLVTANSQVVSLTTEKAIVSGASTNAIINPQVSCTSISVVDTIVTGSAYDRVRIRLKNNSSQTVYLTGSKITWTSSSPLVVDWFSWNSTQYYSGDSSTSPTMYNPTGVLTLASLATGSWIVDFKNQPLAGIKGTFTGNLTVDFTCNYQGQLTR